MGLVCNIQNAAYNLAVFTVVSKLLLPVLFYIDMGCITFSAIEIIHSACL